MTEIEGDILNVTHGIICHQVNCRGKMGAGIALAIRKKWPEVYRDYIAAHLRKELKLGHIVFTEIKKNLLYVASLCGQYNYGRQGQYTNYDAVKMCLTELAKYDDGRLVIHIPKGMGCTLAGGDWNIVSKMIDSIIPNAIIINKI